jgi:hypothetical protein
MDDAVKASKSSAGRMDRLQVLSSMDYSGRGWGRASLGCGSAR